MILSTLMLIPAMKIKHSRNQVNNAILQTDMIVEKCGHVISLNGSVGKGKTLTMVLMAHSKCRTLQYRLEEKQEEIIKQFPDIDFYKLNMMIEEYCQNYTYQSAEIIYKKFFGNLDGVYFDFINIKSFRKQLTDYIDFYYILNYRMNFFISNFYVFSRITYTSSKVLPDKELEIRNQFKLMNDCLDRCLIVLKDEQNVENGNVNSNKKETKESGEKEFYSLIRQIYEGMLYVIKTKQVHEDEYIGARRLETATIDVNSCDDIIYDFKGLKKNIDRLLKFYKWIFDLKYKFIPIRKIREEKIRTAYLKVNWYRKKENHWTGVKNYLTSLGLLVINVDITIGKHTQENVELYFPLREGYGCYETHEYSCVRKELAKMSKTSYETQDVNDRFDTEKKRIQKTRFLYENKKEVDDYGF